MKNQTLIIVRGGIKTVYHGDQIFVIRGTISDLFKQLARGEA